MEFFELLPDVQFYTHKKTRRTIDYIAYRKVFDQELQRRWQMTSEVERKDRYDNDIAALHCYMSDFLEYDEYYDSDEYGNPL